MKQAYQEVKPAVTNQISLSKESNKTFSLYVAFTIVYSSKDSTVSSLDEFLNKVDSWE